VDAEHACFLFGVSLHYADTFFSPVISLMRSHDLPSSGIDGK